MSSRPKYVLTLPVKWALGSQYVVRLQEHTHTECESWAGGSHNKSCWVKYLYEINSGDKTVIRDHCGGVKTLGGGVEQTTRAFSCEVEIRGGGESRESGRLVERGNPPGWVPMACQRSLD